MNIHFLKVYKNTPITNYETHLTPSRRDTKERETSEAYLYLQPCPHYYSESKDNDRFVSFLLIQFSAAFVDASHKESQTHSKKSLLNEQTLSFPSYLNTRDFNLVKKITLKKVFFNIET